MEIGQTCCEKPLSPINAALNDLSGIVGRVGKSTEELAIKIEPVTSVKQENEISKPNPDGNTILEKAIKAEIDRLEIINDSLINLANRVQL